MSDKLGKLFGELSAAALYGTSTTTEPSAGAFTMADLQRAYDLVKAIAPPPVWYATTKYIDRGKLYVLPAQTLGLGLSMPELHVIHEDFEAAFCEAYPHAKHVRQRWWDEQGDDKPTE